MSKLYIRTREVSGSRSRFPWPAAGDGAVRLTSAQLAMLWEGIDWRRPDWGAPPARVS
ncbi:IS66 family insertion sequence element accessory protein TnpB [Actibacterium sp. D379-3]